MSRPFRPVEHYTPGGAAMADAIERLERELAATRADLAAILPLVPGLTLDDVRALGAAPAGAWSPAVEAILAARSTGSDSGD